jgi:hypothetical protein
MGPDAGLIGAALATETTKTATKPLMSNLQQGEKT